MQFSLDVMSHRLCKSSTFQITKITMDSFMHKHQGLLDSQREEDEINWLFPQPDNDEILERLYDEAWEDYRKEHNLTDDELYELEQNSDTGVIPEIEEEAKRRFEESVEPSDEDMMSSFGTKWHDGL